MDLDALDDDLEAFLEAWDEIDREATAVLLTALEGVRGERAPGDETQLKTAFWILALPWYVLA